MALTGTPALHQVVQWKAVEFQLMGHSPLVSTSWAYKNPLLFDGSPMTVTPDGVAECEGRFKFSGNLHFAALGSAAIALQQGDLPALLFGQNASQMLTTCVGDVICRRRFDSPVSSVGVSNAAFYVAEKNSTLWAGETIACIQRILTLGTIGDARIYSGTNGILYSTQTGIVIINGALPPTGLHVTNVHSAGWSASEQAWIVLVNASTFPAILRIAPGTTHVMSYRSHLSVETILPDGLIKAGSMLYTWKS